MRVTRVSRARPKNEKDFLQRHIRDKYTKRALEDDYRSRAAYKLLEIDKKHKVLTPGSAVVDLGCFPGGWSQIAARRVRFGAGLEEINPLPRFA